MVNGLEFEIGSTLGLGFSADQVKVFVPTYAEVQGKVAAELPIILEVSAKHLGASRQIKVRVTRGCGHATNSPRCREALWIARLIFGWAARLGITENDAGFIIEIDLERWIEFKESAKLSFPNIINTGPNGVFAPGDREIILELILRLVGLLRHVCICAEADAGRECKQRDFAVGINQVIPVLITDGSRINYSATQYRVQCEVAKLESVFRKVALS